MTMQNMIIPLFELDLVSIGIQMCGRYSLYSAPNKIAKIFAIKQPFELQQSYNIAPTENISAVIMSAGERCIVTMRWGLIPSWMNKIPSSVLINARIETIETKPSFKNPAKFRRCLIIANGFFEWQHAGTKQKQPYYIEREDKMPFALAGIYENWEGANQAAYTCCIITLPPNPLLATLHDRMPAIVPMEHYDEWLEPNNMNWLQVKSLLTSIPHESLKIKPVSPKVNNAKYKGNDCIDPS